MINIISIGIDKVQMFIYNVLQVNIQENQTNSGTLKKITQSSNLISQKLYRDIGLEESSDGEFTNHIEETLLKCSGMCIFSTTLSEKLIKEKLNYMFKRFYKENRGQLLLKYVCFQHVVSSDEEKLESIKKGKKLLMRRGCMNEIIQHHAKMLFQFNKLSANEEEAYNNDIQRLEDSAKYPLFSNEIDDLYSKDEMSNNNRFRTVVIKADLDGMGNVFNKISCFKTYQGISEILSKYISLKHLHKEVEEIKKGNQEFKLYPLYVAGDDMFFVVHISQIETGISICRSILKKINCELGEQSKVNITLSMSIGIDFTFNREPIRYYYTRVEEQLELAKKAKEFDEKRKKIKVAIQGYVFYIFDDEEDKEDDKLNWNNFIQDIDLLTSMKMHLQKTHGDDYELHNFFYSLLQKITNPTIYKNTTKYSNICIYHLLPRYLGHPSRELQDTELVLLESLIKQMCEEKEGKWRLSFENKKMEDIEKYIRLLLLFTDKRFDIQKSKENYKLVEKKIKKIREDLFDEILHYLYNNNLNEESDLRDIFIKRKKYEKKFDKVKIYQTLRISNSMLYRMKKDGSIEYKKIGKMIDDIVKIDKSKEIMEEYSKSKYLVFEKEKFHKVASRGWTKDFLDSLIVFYKLNELNIEYGNIYSNKNKKTSQKREHIKKFKRS